MDGYDVEFWTLLFALLATPLVARAAALPASAQAIGDTWLGSGINILHSIFEKPHDL